MELICLCLLGLVSLTSGVIVYYQNTPAQASYAQKKAFFSRVV
jgi:hypothetical protein